VNTAYRLKSREKGQTLVVVIIIMVLALMVGVMVSNRFIRTLRNLSETDNSSRARATAEALVERLLLETNGTLEGYINFNNCGSNCTLEISGFLGPPVTAKADLSFSGASTEPFQISGRDGEMSQVLLGGYESGSSVDVCWSGDASIYASYIYDQSGVIGSKPYAYNPVNYMGLPNGFSDATVGIYPNCFTVTTSHTPKVLRIKPLNSDAYIFVVPIGGRTIPSQGIVITSTGKAGNTTKTVQVLKSTAFAVDYLDYVIYQKSALDPLSNRPN